jgi:hypothetical protein
LNDWQGGFELDHRPTQADMVVNCGPAQPDPRGWKPQAHADATDQIQRGRDKREEEDKTAVAWLKAKREEIGLTALAKIHSANLAKPRRGLC